MVILLYWQAHAAQHPSITKKCAALTSRYGGINSWLEILAIGTSRERQAIPTAPLTSIQDLLCRWHDRQLDKEPRTPLPPRVYALFTSVPSKCSLSVSLILNDN
ncbi:hypothetical protein Zmor_000687 [Zophobas morio]|uniref:Uncharacterized protein n=1 Tax=Zophobas morio TaxID=2755281 RepID=A0AA38J0F9_9CUCU|nr:hypothetical protein Zmor_000687 [Zophobas morio]